MCWRLRFPPKGLVVASSDKADVAELADALDSKSSTGNSVWVRSPPSAERDSERCSPFTSRQGTPFLRCQAGMLRLLRARLDYCVPPTAHFICYAQRTAGASALSYHIYFPLLVEFTRLAI
jgi:hypothetical protein